MLGQVVTFTLALAYPVIVFATLTFWGLQVLGLATLIFGALRIMLRFGTRWRNPDTPSPRFDALGTLLIVVGTLIFATASEVSARLYPVVINLSLLGYFAWTLIYPPTAIERIARIREPELPGYAVDYTRRVTGIWCGFFFLNGSIALYTTFWSSLAVWTVYNGVVAYTLMGCLFGGEYLVRRRVRASHETA